MTTGYDLINSYYESEKLYSTGDSDLDDLLEKAFCDGYEYAQREFGNPQNKAAKKELEMKKGLELIKKFPESFKGKNAVRVGRGHQKEHPGFTINPYLDKIENVDQAINFRDFRNTTNFGKRIGRPKRDSQTWRETNELIKYMKRK